MDILIASANPDKRKEMELILRDLPVRLLSLADFPGASEVEETGETFAQNAAKKAVEIADYSGHYTVADDSGLCVAALDGDPGVRSARYAGPHGTYRDVCRKLLRIMRGLPDSQRGAHFVCHIAFADPEGDVVLRAEGRCEGMITRQMRGGRGFGYDPIFLYPAAGKTFAQMLPEEKNKFSHRGAALAQFQERLSRWLKAGDVTDP